MKDVVQGYGERVRFVSENWGESKLAKRFGITRYPVVFVDDILIAQPDDFGWFGAKGKYTPWRDKANHDRFQRDLARMIDLSLRGEKALARSEGATTLDAAEIASLPSVVMQDLRGDRLDAGSLAGRVVVVEFWATWCAPCISTLGYLGALKRRYGDDIVVIAMAVESKEEDVRKMSKILPPSVNVVMGSEALVTPFGTLSSVPRMYVFDKSGKTAGNFFGAPLDLHRRVGRLINSLIK